MFKLEAFFVSRLGIPVLCRFVTELILSFVSVTMSEGFQLNPKKHA